MEKINTQGSIINFDSLIDFSLMNKYIDILSSRYLFLSVTSIGQTVLGRRIPLISIGRGKKTVIYIGGQAGTESESVSILLRYINELCEYISNDGRFYNCSAAYFFATRTVIIVPMLNPDGIEYCHHGIDEANPLYENLIKNFHDFSSWEGNARGVELKNNYGNSFEDLNTFEQETGALRNYLMFNKDIRLAVSLGKGNNTVSCTHIGTTPPKLTSVGIGISRLCCYDYLRENGNGTLCNFCANELVIPSFEIKSNYSDNDNFFEDYCRIRSALFLAPTMI